MSPDLNNPAVVCASWMLGVLSIALLFTFYRLVRGPSIPDRVVALDASATLIVGMICLYSITSAEPVFLRVAMVVALVSFVGTVAFAYYLQMRASE